jgi:hypothetical protein
MKITHTYPKTTQDEFDEKWGAPPPDKVDEKVMARHHKVAEIINRHLREIEDEILRFDPDAMNMDNAGDKAEIARQVLTLLVDQLRGFGVGNRNEIRGDQKRRAKLPMDLLKDKMRRAFRELTAGGDGARESDLIAAFESQGVDPEVERSLMEYALKHLIEELVN